MRTKSATSKRKTPTSLEHLQRRCDRLQKERDRLREELVKVSAERDQCAKAVGILMAREQGEIEFDKKTILAQVGKGQSMDELIAELEAEGS